MPNYFDQFDSSSTSFNNTNAGKKPSGNYFDQFDNANYIPTYTGLARNTIAGTNEGIATVAGAPVDAMTWGLNKGIQGINKVAGRDAVSEIQSPFGGSDSIMRGI